MKIKVTQKITYLEGKRIQENQTEITFAKVVQSLNTKPETKETSTQFNEKDSVIQPNSKIITATTKPKPKLHLPISQDHKQNHLKAVHLKAVHKHSRIKQVDHNRDLGPGHLIRKEKMQKKKHKDKEKGPNPYSKGASADPIKLVNWFDSLENMELEVDFSMLSQSQRKQKD